MFDKIITYCVRFAALVSMVTLISGHSKSDNSLLLIEFVMIFIWLQMDWRVISTLASKIFSKEKKN